MFMENPPTRMPVDVGGGAGGGGVSTSLTP